MKCFARSVHSAAARSSRCARAHDARPGHSSFRPADRHLDVENIEALEDALEDYDGSVLLVVTIVPFCARLRRASGGSTARTSGTSMGHSRVGGRPGRAWQNPRKKGGGGREARGGRTARWRREGGFPPSSPLGARLSSRAARRRRRAGQDVLGARGRGRAVLGRRATRSVDATHDDAGRNLPVRTGSPKRIMIRPQIGAAIAPLSPLVRSFSVDRNRSRSFRRSPVCSPRTRNRLNRLMFRSCPRRRRDTRRHAEASPFRNRSHASTSRSPRTRLMGRAQPSQPAVVARGLCHSRRVRESRDAAAAVCQVSQVSHTRRELERRRFHGAEHDGRGLGKGPRIPASFACRITRSSPTMFARRTVATLLDAASA